MDELPPIIQTEKNTSEPIDFKIPEQRSGHKGLIVAIVVMVILLAAGGGGYWFFVMKGSANPEQPKEELNQENPEALPEEICDEACFIEKFTLCEPATTDFTVSDDMIYHDEIIGTNPENGLCNVKVSFKKNPSPDFMNKEMICGYDQNIVFNEAVKDTSNCSGDLYEMMATLSIRAGIQKGTPEEAVYELGLALVRGDIEAALQWITIGDRDIYQIKFSQMDTVTMKLLGNQLLQSNMVSGGEDKAGFETDFLLPTGELVRARFDLEKEADGTWKVSGL